MRPLAEIRYRHRPEIPAVCRAPYIVTVRDGEGVKLPLSYSHRSEEEAREDARHKLASLGGGELAVYDLNGYIQDGELVAPGSARGRLSLLAA